MRDDVLGLGWVVRRSADPITQGEFYRNVLGLPELRRRDTDRAKNIMMWAGGYSDIETIWQGQVHPPVSKAEDAELVPIFRARDSRSVSDRLKEANTPFISSTIPEDNTVFFIDPAGFVCGLRPAADGSDIASDVEADRLWNLGMGRLSNTTPISSDLQDIGWLRLHVADPDKIAAFYNNEVGLDLLENNGSSGLTLHLGGPAALEICPGGKSRPVPADRKEVPDVWILRGYDHHGFAVEMAEKNVPLVNSLTLGAGSLNYYADPEGHVFGYQQRNPYDPDDPVTHRIEDRLLFEIWKAQELNR